MARLFTTLRTVSGKFDDTGTQKNLSIMQATGVSLDGAARANEQRFARNDSTAVTGVAHEEGFEGATPNLHGSLIAKSPGFVGRAG
jgi:hypothetical protein